MPACERPPGAKSTPAAGDERGLRLTPTPCSELPAAEMCDVDVTDREPSSVQLISRAWCCCAAARPRATSVCGGGEPRGVSPVPDVPTSGNAADKAVSLETLRTWLGCTATPAPGTGPAAKPPTRAAAVPPEVTRRPSGRCNCEAATSPAASLKLVELPCREIRAPLVVGALRRLSRPHSRLLS